jgi:GNAT superfamily N-acetyltransferase
MPFTIVDGSAGRRPTPVRTQAGLSILDQVCLDIPPDTWSAESVFWSGLTGSEIRAVEGFPEFSRLTSPVGQPYRFLLQRLDEPAARVSAHLDLAADSWTREASRHRDLGATTRTEGDRWIVMQDPSERTYCITRRAVAPSGPPKLEVREATGAELLAAANVWERARIAGGRRPSAARRARVHDKLHDPSGLVTVAMLEGDLIGMTLLEPARHTGGAGDVIAGRAHVAMVFVDPAHQGAGVGRVLMDGTHELAHDRGWLDASLWTRTENTAARSLYQSAGYRETGKHQVTSTGDHIDQWLRAAHPRLGDATTPGSSE